MTTPLFLLRCLQIGLSLRDLELLTIGMVNDLYCEFANDDFEYDELGTQELIEAERTGNERLILALPYVRKMVTGNLVTFSRKELQEALRISERRSLRSVQALQDAGLVTKTTKSYSRLTRYALNYRPGKDIILTDEKKVDIQVRNEREELAEFIRNGPSYVPEWMRPELTKMLEKRSIHCFRAVKILLKVLQNGKTTFTARQCEDWFGLSKNQCPDCMHAAIGSGLVRKRGKNTGTYYEICMDPDLCVSPESEASENAVPSNPMINDAVLKKVLDAFGAEPFVRSSCADLLGISSDGAAYHLKRMEQSGILRSDRTCSPVRYTFTPEYLESLEDHGKDQSAQAEAAIKRLKKNAAADPDLAGFWTLPGEAPDPEKTQWLKVSTG